MNLDICCECAFGGEEKERKKKRDENVGEETWGGYVFLRHQLSGFTADRGGYGL